MKGIKLPDTREQSYEEVVMRDDFLAEKERQGIKIIEPLSDEVFVYVDTDEDFQEFLSRITRLTELDIKCRYTVTPSKSGLPHRHIKVKMFTSLNDWERVALQWAFKRLPVNQIL